MIASTSKVPYLDVFMPTNWSATLQDPFRAKVAAVASIEGDTSGDVEVPLKIYP